MKNKILALTIIVTLVSCVSKKKYTELESRYKATKSSLAFMELKNKKIQKHVENYNKKITLLSSQNGDLQVQNKSKFDLVGDVGVMSQEMKDKLSVTLSNVDPSVLASAKTLKDSMNIALSHTIKNSISGSDIENSDVNVSVDRTVVMISIADNLLFRSGSYKISKAAHPVLSKLVAIIKSEPSMDIMIEGHTDSKTISTPCIKDNWDLSVKRATSMVRTLQKKYGIESNRLIASGRGSSLPLNSNSNRKERAANRRTKVIIMPNLDKFFGMMAVEEKVIDGSGEKPVELEKPVEGQKPVDGEKPAEGEKSDKK